MSVVKRSLTAVLLLGLLALSGCAVYEQPAPRAYYPVYAAPAPAYVYGPPVGIYRGGGWGGGWGHHGWR